MANDTWLPTELSPSDRARQQAQHAYIDKALSFSIHSDVKASLSAAKEGKIHTLDISTIARTSVDSTDEHSLIHTVDHIHPYELTKPNTLDQQYFLKLGDYDFITLRLLHTALRHDQWDLVPTHLIKLLKPGGWIQWVDWDPSTLRIAGVRPGTPDATTLRSLLRQYTDALSVRKVGSTYRIEALFKREGLLEVDSDMYPIAPEVEFTKNVVEGVVRELAESGVLGLEEAEKVRAEVGEEVEKGGVLVWWDLWCHVGRKPS